MKILLHLPSAHSAIPQQARKEERIKGGEREGGRGRRKKEGGKKEKKKQEKQISSFHIKILAMEAEETVRWLRAQAALQENPG